MISKFRYANIDGDTIAEMRANMERHKLKDHGDVVLVWINEGDLWNGECIIGHHPKEEVKPLVTSLTSADFPAIPDNQAGDGEPAPGPEEMVSLPKAELLEMLDIIDEMVGFCSGHMLSERYYATCSAHWVISHRACGNDAYAEKLKAELLEKRAQYYEASKKVSAQNDAEKGS